MKENMNTRRTLLLLPAIASAAALAAACSPEPKSGIPITGVLTFASGGAAPLTLDATDQGPRGADFQMTATLDSQQVAVTAQPWACFGPLPPDYPNFDIEAGDEQTFGFFLAIDPAQWGTGGTISLGDEAHLLVAMPDRFGIADSGSVTLTSAPFTPDTSGNDCGFTVNGPLALEGERDR